MPYIPPEVVAKAKEMDLLTYLKNYEPSELVHFGGSTYCTRTHDSLKISNGKWCWFSRGIGGKTALDYLIKVREIPFTEAVEMIVGQATIQPPTYAPVPKKDTPKVSMVWSYIGELVFNMLVLVGAVKMADRVVREMMGL